MRKRVRILTGFKEWEREAWGGVSGKDTLTKFVECKSERKVKERDFDRFKILKKDGILIQLKEWKSEKEKLEVLWVGRIRWQSLLNASIERVWKREVKF
jgi:hypothetical protein